MKKDKVDNALLYVIRALGKSGLAYEITEGDKDSIKLVINKKKYKLTIKEV